MSKNNLYLFQTYITHFTQFIYYIYKTLENKTHPLCIYVFCENYTSDKTRIPNVMFVFKHCILNDTGVGWCEGGVYSKRQTFSKKDNK